MSIGVPVKLLHEAENHVITIELKNGELYRGTLHEAEDNMNCHLSNKGTDLVHTDRFVLSTPLYPPLFFFFSFFCFRCVKKKDFCSLEGCVPTHTHTKTSKLSVGKSPSLIGKEK